MFVGEWSVGECSVGGGQWVAVIDTDKLKSIDLIKYGFFILVLQKVV